MAHDQMGRRKPRKTLAKAKAVARNRVDVRVNLNQRIPRSPFVRRRGGPGGALYGPMAHTTVVHTQAFPSQSINEQLALLNLHNAARSAAAPAAFPVSTQTDQTGAQLDAMTRQLKSWRNLGRMYIEHEDRPMGTASTQTGVPASGANQAESGPSRPTGTSQETQTGADGYRGFYQPTASLPAGWRSLRSLTPRRPFVPHPTTRIGSVPQAQGTARRAAADEERRHSRRHALMNDRFNEAHARMASDDRPGFGGPVRRRPPRATDRSNPYAR